MLAAFGLLSGCASHRKPDVTPIARELDARSLSPEDADVVEAVFRHWLTPAKRDGVAVGFLRIGKADPSQEFLARLADCGLRVRPASEASWSTELLPSGSRDHGGVVEYSTGTRGMIVSVWRIRWMSSERVEVESGCVTGRRAGVGVTHLVQRKAGKWVAVETKTWTVS